MLKNFVIIFFMTLGLKASAQYDKICFKLGKRPFKFRQLEETAKISISNDTINPLYINGKFYYQNTRSKKLAWDKGYDEAYPFCKGYAVVKVSGRYGIIGRHGEPVLQPLYASFDIDEYSPLIELGSKEFDYDTGKLTDRVFSEVIPYFPHNETYEVKGKYGIKFRNGHHTAALFDTVLSADFGSFAIVKLNNKIGVVGVDGQILIPFIYHDYTAGYPNGLALRNRKKWDYFENCKRIFISRYMPVLWRYDKIIFRSEGCYGSLNKFGDEVLPARYKWISLTSPIAINNRNQVVFYSKGKPDFVYYTFTNENSSQ